VEQLSKIYYIAVGYATCWGATEQLSLVTSRSQILHIQCLGGRNWTITFNIKPAQKLYSQIFVMWCYYFNLEYLGVMVWPLSISFHCARSRAAVCTAFPLALLLEKETPCLTIWWPQLILSRCISRMETRGFAYFIYVCSVVLLTV
jgi:hypothetical protein